MARYHVVIGRMTGKPSVSRVRAATPRAAYETVRSRLIATGGQLDTCWVAVRRRGFRRFAEHEQLAFVGAQWPDEPDGPEEGGGAGVREPRRPKPSPPYLEIALDEPR